MSGYSLKQLTGRVFKVDLTECTVEEIEVANDTYRRFLGGRGLNQFLLARNVEQETAPLAPENILAFAAGLLVGTSAPAAIRLSVDTKSLFSGGIGSANAGGEFARVLKLAGIGAILVTGRAEHPVYIAIEEGKVTIRDAEWLWGKTTSETDDAIRGVLGQAARVLCIGPAGERLVRGACVVVDKARAAAKCGGGGVMGSKQLKAIAAVPESGFVGVADPAGFNAIVRHLWDKVLSSAIVEEMNVHGTLSSTSKNAIGGVPLRHYKDGYMEPKSFNKLSAEAFKQYETLRFTARGCPLKCRAKYAITDGPYKGTYGEAMEANTIQDFGYKLDITYPPAIIKANILCNEYGMDMDTVAESIAWAFECFDKGILTLRDTDGLKLTWGNHEALIALIKRIAKRVGFGDILAEGSQRAAQILGRGSELVVTMKGQDLYETVRMPKGYSLGAALATRGGGHCSGSPLTEFSPGAIPPEMSERIYGVRTASNPTVYEGKAKLVAFHERLHAVLNSLGICYFMTISENPDLLDWADLAELVSTATGWEMEKERLMNIGERIHTLERAINWRNAGFDRKDDYPPKRFFEEPIKSGPCAGEILDKDEFDSMLTENYALHRWNENGLPSKKVLHQLGLEDVCTNF